MSYLVRSEFVTKMADAGESKIFSQPEMPSSERIWLVLSLH